MSSRPAKATPRAGAATPSAFHIFFRLSAVFFFDMRCAHAASTTRLCRYRPMPLFRTIRRHKTRRRLSFAESALLLVDGDIASSVCLPMLTPAAAVTSRCCLRRLAFTRRADPPRRAPTITRKRLRYGRRQRYARVFDFRRLPTMPSAPMPTQNACDADARFIDAFHAAAMPAACLRSFTSPPCSRLPAIAATPYAVAADAKSLRQTRARGCSVLRFLFTLIDSAEPPATFYAPPHTSCGARAARRKCRRCHARRYVCRATHACCDDEHYRHARCPFAADAAAATIRSLPNQPGHVTTATPCDLILIHHGSSNSNGFR